MDAVTLPRRSLRVTNRRCTQFLDRSQKTGDICKASSCSTGPYSRDSTSHFFRLPLELRQEIYFYALQLDPAVRDMHPEIGPAVVYVDGYRTSVSEEWIYWGTERMTRLLRANRQIYHEATPVLYTRFTFAFTMPVLIRSFFEVVPRNSCAQIRCVSVSYIVDLRFLEPNIFSINKDGGRFDMFKLLLDLPSLKRVTLALHFVSAELDRVVRDFAVDRLVECIDHFHRIDAAVIMSYFLPSLQCAQVIRAVMDKIEVIPAMLLFETDGKGTEEVQTRLRELGLDTSLIPRADVVNIIVRPKTSQRVFQNPKTLGLLGGDSKSGAVDPPGHQQEAI